MPLLVSDANIFIDLEEGGLIEQAFKLPERIEVPDLLFADELAQDHGDLLERGLEVSGLSQTGMEDLLALTLATGASPDMTVRPWRWRVSTRARS